MTDGTAFHALTRAFLQSYLNNRSRLVMTALALVIAVNAVFQLPLVLKTLGQGTVKVAVIDGTPSRLTSALQHTAHVKIHHVHTPAQAKAELDAGRTDASVQTSGQGILIMSSGIYGNVASKTVASAAYQQHAAARDPFTVTEERDPTHSQLLTLLLPSLLTLTLVTSGYGMCARSLGALRSSGMLLRLRATGVRATPLLGAVVTANFLLTGGALAVLLSAATLHDASHAHPLALLATTVIGFAELASAGLLIASRFKNAQNATAAIGSFGILFTLPAVAMVPNLTSSTAKTLVTWLPSGSLTEAFRASIGSPEAQSLSYVLPIAAGWALLLLALATRLFRWDNQRG